MKRTVKAEYDRPTTIISKDTILETTKLQSQSSVQIAGHVFGAVEVNASLMITETGKVNGNIKSDFLLVAGEIRGNVDAKQQLHVASSGKILGDIMCGSITMDEGARIEGNFKMNLGDSTVTSVPLKTTNVLD